MTTPENLPNTQPSNSQLFYNAAIRGLLRSEVTYTDAHYLTFDLPPGDNVEGGTCTISNFFDDQLTAAEALEDERYQANARALDTDDPMIPEGLTKKNREGFLQQGVSFLDVAISREGQPDGAWFVIRPQDLPAGNTYLGIAQRAEPIDPNLPPSEPLIYDAKRQVRVPDPFEDPHLLAVYRYLTA